MKKIVCFDFDNVIMDTSFAIKMLILGTGFKEFAAKIDLLLHNTEPKKFFKSVKRIMKFAKGYDADHLTELFLNADLTPGTKELFRRIKKKGYRIVIASINDKDLIKKYLKKHDLLGFVDHIYAAEYLVKDGKLTGEIKGDIIKTEKIGVLRNIEKLYKVRKENIIYIGDGLTDLPIMKKVGKSILFCPNSFTKTEVFASKEFDEMGKQDKFFIAEKKDLREVGKLI
jgi:phosphoserine phosphatase